MLLYLYVRFVYDFKILTAYKNLNETDSGVQAMTMVNWIVILLERTIHGKIHRMKPKKKRPRRVLAEYSCKLSHTRRSRGPIGEDLQDANQDTKRPRISLIQRSDFEDLTWLGMENVEQNCHWQRGMEAIVQTDLNGQ